MSSLEESFAEAQERIKTLQSNPGNDTLLELYSLFKQGTVGDVQGKRPGMLDMKGRAKYDAWSARKGMSADEARRRYVELVDRLVGKA